MTLMAGRVWDAAKNFDVAAEAARGWEPGEVLLAGERRHPESHTRPPSHPLLDLRGIPGAVELESLLDRAAVYLSPARYDPFGLLPLQAALHGCAHARGHHIVFVEPDLYDRQLHRDLVRDRQDMAATGYSPPTRVSEAAGCGSRAGHRCLDRHRYLSAAGL